MSFYAEYMKIRKTYEFLKDTETDASPENYFSSFLPRLHERIESKPARKSVFQYLLGSWKIAVPALTVILLILIFNKSDKVEHINGIPELSNNNSTIPADSNIKESTEVITSTEKEQTENIEKVTTPVKQKNIKVTKEENTAVLNESIFEETEEEDEFYYEDEFYNLNEKEQNEIINNLKNTKF
jgi:hypothetical protein